jgi:hypothetical protein
LIWAKPHFNTKTTKDTKITKKNVGASREAPARVQGQDLRVLCALGELRVKIQRSASSAGQRRRLQG